MISSPEAISFAKEVGAPVSALVLYDLIRLTVGRVMGKRVAARTAEVIERDDTRGGDLEALAEATEPAVAQAHAVIGSGARVIRVAGEDGSLAKMDMRSKEYVTGSNLDTLEDFQDVSIASLNANTGHGRAYVPELGRTVPFGVTKEPDPGTYNALTLSLNRYATGQVAFVQIRFRRVLSQDGQLKRFIVYGATIPRAE